MSSVGGVVGGAVGAVAGFFLGGGPVGALRGASLGMSLGGLLDPPRGPNIEQRGPRLDDLSVQTSTYGAVIPRGYGMFPVVGNIFWLENNALREVASTSTSRSGGGKGGGGGSSTTTTTYSYYATFAVGLCQGPIIGVRRIWVGAKLIHDAGASDLASLSASAEASTLFTLHYGTDTQLADDRMQAILGVVNVPAYRGLAYLVFKDYPLADHGNSLVGAQIKVEVVASGTIVPLSFVDNPAMPALQSTGGTWWALQVDKNGYAWRFDVPQTKMLRIHVPSGSVSCTRSANSSVGSGYYLKGFDTAGNMLCWTNSGMFILSPNGAEQSAPGGLTNTQHFSTAAGIWCTASSPGLKIFTVSAGSVAANAPAGTYNPITAGNSLGAWVHFTFYDGATTVLGRFDPVNNLWQGLFSIANTYTGEGAGGMTRIVAGADGYFYVYNSASDRSEKYDANGVLLATAPNNTGLPVMMAQNGMLVTRTSGNTCYALESASLAVVGSVAQAGQIIFDTFGVGWMMVGRLTAVVLDIPASGAVSLSAIVSAECLRSNLLTAPDIDVASLTQSVRGYRVSEVAPLRSAIDQLQAAWPFDVVQHGYQVKFVPRGQSSIATVPAADLDAHAADASAGPAITYVREMDTQLPASMVITYMDVEREYDTGQQSAARLNTSAVNVESISLAIALTATEAAQIAERLLYLRWRERFTVSLRLPGTYNQVEPTDVITVNATETTYTLRVTAITYTEDGRLECEAKANPTSVYTPAAIGESGAATGKTVAYAGDSAVELLDIPLLADSSDTPGYAVAMSGYTASWPGGELVTTTDGGQTWTALQAFTAPGAVMGIASASIGAGRTDLVDKASTLPISLRTGALASVTEAAMLNGANHFAYGINGRWEIIAAQTCTLQGDGTYVLTDLLRGRAGTEWACGLHAANDSVVLLDAAVVPLVRTSVDAIGVANTYRGVTRGKDLSAVVDTTFTYTGMNLECLSPVYLNGNRHPSTNDWTLTWLRRTRIGGEWRDYVDAVLGEASEAYEVDIFSSNTYATLKRTLSGLSTPTATYTSAQQVTDFGSNQGTLYVKVYQLSANVGRGIPLTTSITR